MLAHKKKKNLVWICPSLHSSIWPLLKWGSLKTWQSRFDSKSHKSSKLEHLRSDLLKHHQDVLCDSTAALSLFVDAVCEPSSNVLLRWCGWSGTLDLHGVPSPFTALLSLIPAENQNPPAEPMLQLTGERVGLQHGSRLLANWSSKKNSYTKLRINHQLVLKSFSNTKIYCPATMLLRLKVKLHAVQGCLHQLSSVCPFHCHFQS